jgi:hypothetical protein
MKKPFRNLISNSKDVTVDLDQKLKSIEIRGEDINVEVDSELTT